MDEERDARTKQGTADQASDRTEVGRGDESTDAEAGRGGENASVGTQVGGGQKNVSAEPLPDLSEHGGVEPRERDPSKYNDRTRDRELDER